MNNFLANWPAPQNVKAFTTTKNGGVSNGYYESNNMGLHVGDITTHVEANRQQLQKFINVQNPPAWLNQTHTTHCIIVEETLNRDADAAITRQANTPLAIMTGDCLPILVCNNKGNEIAAIHAGWRGLAGGVIEHTLAKMNSSADELIVWIGPAICQNCYSVGFEVREQFLNHYPQAHTEFFLKNDRWAVSLDGIAQQILSATGIKSVYLSKSCTFENKNQFYSYRRSTQTGRMVSLIWFTDTKQDKK